MFGEFKTKYYRNVRSKAFHIPEYKIKYDSYDFITRISLFYNTYTDDEISSKLFYLSNK